MGSSYNRTKGHNYERQLAQEFRELGYIDCKTSRAESRTRDDEKVDLVGTGCFNVQAKFVKAAPNTHTLIFKDMPDEEGQVNVVFLKRPRQGETVTMSKEDFYKIVQQINAKQDDCNCI